MNKDDFSSNSSAMSNLNAKSGKLKLEDFSLQEIINLVKINDAAFKTLNERVSSANIQELREAAPAFEELLNEWKDKIAVSTEKAEFCIKLADLSILETKTFRTALNYAIRKLLPPYIVSGTVVKSLGALDHSVGVREVASRLKKLQHLRTTAIIYQTKSKQVGRISGIDRLEATISIETLDGKNSTSLPIATAILNSYFFETTPELISMLNPLFASQLKPQSEYPRLLKHFALSTVPDDIIEDIVRSVMVPQIFKDDNAFNQWYRQETNNTKLPANRRSFDCARSVLELHTLLGPVLKYDPKKGGDASEAKISIDDAMADRLSGMLRRVKYEQAQDIRMLAECIAVLAEADGVTIEMRQKMFGHLCGKVNFWPIIKEDSTDWVNVEKLQNWGKIPVRFLQGMKDATLAMYSIDEFVKFAMELPVRCMVIFLENKDNPELDKQILEKAQDYLWARKELTTDQCLWIWKNIPRLNEDIILRLNMEAIVTAMNQAEPPKEWGNPHRDLLKLLQEKKEFQLLLIKNCYEDFNTIADGLKKLRAPKTDKEKATANMRRNSPALAELLSTAAGREMFAMKGKSASETYDITSNASLRALKAELEDLKNNQIPANEKALAIARSYGDLRENAEYDAAKERKRFLHGRRNEIERDIAKIKGTDFTDVSLAEGKVVPGCVVTISGKDGQKVFYLLGVKDGDFQRGRLSYKSPLGQAMIGHKVGEKVALPDGTTTEILEINPLPAEMLAEMA